MEFTELADYAVPAGTLTEWIPSVGPQARTPEAAGWRPDTRPTSYVHEAHLRTSLSSPRRGRESWLGAAFEVAGPLNKPAFRQAVLNWIDRHEAMRSSASIDETTGEMSRVTAAEGAIDIWQVEQERCSQSSEVFEHLQYLFDEFTSPLIWPAYAFVTLEPLDDTRPITVFFAADHSIIDGLSTVLVAHEIAALYGEALGGPAAALFEAGSYLDFGSSERERHAELEHSHDAVRMWRDFLVDGDGELPAFPLDIGDPSPEDVPQGGLSAWVLDAEQADSFSTACRKTGHSLFAGLLAVLAITGAELGGGTCFRTVTPVHTRDEPQWASALGWFVGLCPISFDIGGDDSFGSVIAAASAEVKKTKPIARVPLDRVFTTLGYSARPRFVVSFMDVRFAPAAEHWPDWNARALRSKQYQHDVYVWINRTPQGINIAARYPNTEQATARVHEYVGALRRLLTEVADTGTARIPGTAPEPFHDGNIDSGRIATSQ
ncbi:condensation protein [Rhodococcus sp. 06-412-2C]|uniref:condensation domain-containing protein n=1 Tax=unclassified Rhodococcus (in: high G+C Gram-positive bacteria) TaxID=192944 RepID=UPI000B9B969F|nr:MULTISPECIES: condensation domain-containing protein [unclassified Rhodococcus (in: high G+C Gram-positive bacteria)]OZC92697.1 condensation protein [Rhodococcus sp. 06-412-2C]OZC95414.1 condensation protein [Rhodococcus sp. 06-412-2B]